MPVVDLVVLVMHHHLIPNHRADLVEEVLVVLEQHQE
jgi:hypothetical protein